MMVIELENNSRSVYRFKSYKRETREDGKKGPPMCDEPRSFVLGDAADHDRHLPTGFARGPRTPNPIVRLTPEFVLGLDKQVRDWIDFEVAARRITRRELDVDSINAPLDLAPVDSIESLAQRLSGAGKSAAPAQPQQPAAPSADGKGRR